jgi:KDO2-lipid IV(A) lauroyltransferase
MSSSKKKKRSFLSRHPRLKRIAYTFYGLLFIPLFIIVLPLGIFPKRFLYWLGRLVGLYILYPLVRKKIDINLDYAYDGQLSPKRIHAIGRKVAINVAWSVLDCYFLWVFWWCFKIRSIVVDVQYWQTVDDAFAAGNGMFVATAHYNCFEIMPIYFSRGMNITSAGVIARSFPSPFLNWLNRRARLLHHMITFYDEVRGVLKCLRINGAIGVLPDLNARKRLGLTVTFYGKPTRTFDIHFRLASKEDSPVIPAFMMRHRRMPWQYTLMFYPAIKIPHKADEETIQTYVQKLNDVFEYHIRRYPSGWIWFHNKWRLF